MMGMIVQMIGVKMDFVIMKIIIVMIMIHVQKILVRAVNVNMCLITRFRDVRIKNVFIQVNVMMEIFAQLINVLKENANMSGMMKFLVVMKYLVILWIVMIISRTI